jgi:hypothetical protein
VSEAENTESTNETTFHSLSLRSIQSLHHHQLAPLEASHYYISRVAAKTGLENADKNIITLDKELYSLPGVYYPWKCCV